MEVHVDDCAGWNSPGARVIGTLASMDTTERRTGYEAGESLADAERGWSRIAAFPILLAAIFGLLWRGRPVVPNVPHPRVLKDVHLR